MSCKFYFVFKFYFAFKHNAFNMIWEAGDVQSYNPWFSPLSIAINCLLVSLQQRLGHSEHRSSQFCLLFYFFRKQWKLLLGKSGCKSISSFSGTVKQLWIGYHSSRCLHCTGSVDVSSGRKCFTLGRDSFILQDMYKRFTGVRCSELKHTRYFWETENAQRHVFQSIPKWIWQGTHVGKNCFVNLCNNGIVKTNEKIYVHRLKAGLLCPLM